jgi:TPR repeat protein
LVSLGQRYELGKGVQKDAVTACAYYYIALRRGSSVSDLFLDGLTRKMTTEQMKEAQSTASDWSPGKPLPVGATASHP